MWWVSAALIVVLCAALLWTLRARTREDAAALPTHGTMLAVLPLANLTGDPAQEYFSDGLTEELIAQLGNADPQRLSVIARTSVMRYKDAHEPVDEIAQALGAQYVLEGSVRRDSENVRITAQLVRASDQAHVWSRQYDRKLTSVLALQGEIAEEIADEIRSTLGQRAAGVPARVARPPQQYAGVRPLPARALLLEPSAPPRVSPRHSTIFSSQSPRIRAMPRPTQVLPTPTR